MNFSHTKFLSFESVTILTEAALRNDFQDLGFCARTFSDILNKDFHFNISTHDDTRKTLMEGFSETKFIFNRE